MFFLKMKLLEWAGHVRRAKGIILRNVLINKPTGKPLRVKPRNRWQNRVNENIRTVDRTTKLDIALCSCKGFD